LPVWQPPAVLADDCRRHVCQLIPVFGVGRQRAAILEAFEALTAESLAIEAWQRSPERSRINADGTPFQLALDLHEQAAPALQFLGEAGRLDSSADARRTASLVALGRLGRLCGLDSEAAAIAPLLDAFVRAPARAPTPTSLFWLAARFGADRTPALTAYVNAAWGTELERWRRLDRLAADVGAAKRWRHVRSLVEPLAPLGAAITIRAGAAPATRVYLRGYGRQTAWYREVLAAASESATASAAFDTCARALIGDQTNAPTQSVVFSADLGLDAGAKVEFCGHCAFDDDAVAARRIGRWLDDGCLDAPAYGRVLDALTDGQPVPPVGRRAALHAFVGIGVRGSAPYASIYLNPGAVLGRA
jgi:hypothetical protein